MPMPLSSTHTHHLNSDSANACAIQNVKMVVEDLANLFHDEFLKELRIVLMIYSKKIFKVDCISGIIKSKNFSDVS